MFCKNFLACHDMIGTTMDVSTNTTGIREDEIDVQTYKFPGRQTSKTMKDSEGGQTRSRETTLLVGN